MDIIGDIVYLDGHETAAGRGVPGEFPISEAGRKAELLYAFAKRLDMHAESLSGSQLGIDREEAFVFSSRAERMRTLGEQLHGVSSPEEVKFRENIGRGLARAAIFANNAEL